MMNVFMVFKQMLVADQKLQTWMRFLAVAVEHRMSVRMSMAVFVAGVERLGRVASRTLYGFFRYRSFWHWVGLRLRFVGQSAITGQRAVQLRGVGTFQVSFAF